MTTPGQGPHRGSQQGPREGARRPSLREIAAASGVSQATVSRALRNRPGVSPASRRAVEIALATLGMAGTPGPGNEAATTGRPGETPAAGHEAGAAGPARPGGGADPAALYALVQRAPLAAEVDRFERLGVELMRQASSGGAACLRCYVDAQTSWEPEELIDLGVAGVVAMGAGKPARLAGRLAAAGLPTALVAGAGAWEAAVADGGPGAEAGAGAGGTKAPIRFELDDGRGVVTALRHLLQLGHTRIGLAAANGPTTAGIVAEFRRSLAAGLHIVASRDQAPVALAEPTLVAGARAAQTLLDAGCTAVVSASPALSFGVLEATRRRALRIPEHVSLVTVGEMPDAEVLGPPLTQVAYDWQLLAAEVVSGLAPGPDFAPGQVYRVTPDLILRGSEAPQHRR